MLQSSRKHKESDSYEQDNVTEHEYVYCHKCTDFVYKYCSVHGPQLIVADHEVTMKTDPPSVVPRAALTIPHIFLHLARSVIPGAGLGVFSTLTLPRDVRFGPYKGIPTTEVNSTYCWQISEMGQCRVIDAADANRSNWMRYVNCARHWGEQNLIAYQYRGQIYYSTIKTIPKLTELLVFYGSEYASSLNINLKSYNDDRCYKQVMGVHELKRTILVNEKNDGMDVLQEANNNTNESKTPLTQITQTNFSTTSFISTECSNPSSTDSGLNNFEYISSNNNNSCETDLDSRRYSNKKKYLISTHVCDICFKRFKHRRSLWNHKLSHLPTKKFNCAHCEYKTNEKYNFSDHLNLHTKEKMFFCHSCSFSTYSNIALRRHVKRH